VSASAHECSGPPNILVIDDDPDLRESLKDVLEENGYEVHQAAHGKEALAVLDTMPRPCLLLLDWMMPVMGGQEFLSHWRERDEARSVPVLVVSASRDIQAEGVAGVLKKPFSIDALLVHVRRHCSSQ
jgi:CheY-like chemotaxis protein